MPVRPGLPLSASSVPQQCRDRRVTTPLAPSPAPEGASRQSRSRFPLTRRGGIPAGTPGDRRPGKGQPRSCTGTRERAQVPAANPRGCVQPDPLGAATPRRLSLWMEISAAGVGGLAGERAGLTRGFCTRGQRSAIDQRPLPRLQLISLHETSQTSGFVQESWGSL